MPPDQNNTPPQAQGEFEQIIDRLKSANNVLVTISTNPTVDQFAACIGLTLVLNKLGKHANAVFSGAVPSTIDFLQPEKTIEKTTDSLRDFIIALDKAKADKLRYKVENDVVKIFITPYRTSINEKDLQYSQGDFNVDAVIALGVQDKSHLDGAILAHGRILHDATVICISNSQDGKFGAINWNDQNVGSLCEMVADIALELSKDIFDKQNATALLTGIVAETERYSNEKASPHTMSVAGVLMAAGASTQLVSTKLEAQKEEILPPLAEHLETREHSDDGMIEIQHEQPGDNEVIDIPPAVPVEDFEEEEYDDEHQIEIDEHGQLKGPEDEINNPGPNPPTKSRYVNEPPRMGGQLTATASGKNIDGSTSVDPLNTANTNEESILEHHRSSNTIGPVRATGDSAAKDKEGPDIDELANDNSKSLEDIERTVESPHVDDQPADQSSSVSPPPPVPPPFPTNYTSESEE